MMYSGRSLLFIFLAGFVIKTAYAETGTLRYDTGSIRIFVKFFAPTRDSIAVLRYKEIEKERSVLFESKEREQKIINNASLFEIDSASLLEINPNTIFQIPNTVDWILPWVAEPGDDIRVSYYGEKIVYTGKGADKYRLLYTIDSIRRNEKVPSNRRPHYTQSVQDYYEWCSYTNRMLEKISALIQSYKVTVSNNALHYIHVMLTERFLSQQLSSFENLLYTVESIREDTILLTRLYDSTISPLWTKITNDRNELNVPIRNFVELKAYRKYNFNFWHPELMTKPQRNAVRYQEIYETVHGPLREPLLAEFIIWKVIKDVIKIDGSEPLSDMLLNRYYSEAQSPEYRKIVRDIELSTRVLQKHRVLPEYVLADQNGSQYSKKDFGGKILIMNFWAPDSDSCRLMSRVLENVMNEFKQDTNVLLINISGEADQSVWKKCMNDAIYVPRSGSQFNCYVNGADQMLRKYNVTKFPTVYIMNDEGGLLESGFDSSDPNIVQNIKGVINSFRPILEDGPYIKENKNKKVGYYIKGSTVYAQSFDRNSSNTFSVATDMPEKKFTVSLKPAIQTAPSTFPMPSRLLALSDIEGNFDALRKLLQTNGVIDANFNWTFGEGHLVFAGDMFDRGKQVTECLWLMYALEEKAKKAGGYVHFILGNHEIMNMSGDHFYNREKYRRNSKLLGMSYNKLFGDSTELGTWLRSKNIIEKIGNNLFLHAGVSREVNELGLSVEEINRIARPYYDMDTIAARSNDRVLSVLYNSKPGTSPFWNRTYYQYNDVKTKTNNTVSYKTPMSVVDSTLQLFGVSHIVTGHTIYRKPGEEGSGDITLHYDNKVINTDTYHAYGKSVALLIENGQYYQVDDKGQRKLLFGETHKPKTGSMKN